MLQGQTLNLTRHTLVCPTSKTLNYFNCPGAALGCSTYGDASRIT